MGIDLSVRIVAEGLDRLNPGGQLLLYTGSPVVQGISAIPAAMQEILAQRRGLTWRCVEIDPDVFGEELERPCYRGVERLAAVGVVIQRQP